MLRSPYKIDELLKITEFFSMFECIRPGGYNFSGETHDFWECVYVADGKVSVTADERIYNMEKGDFIFHKPLELHKLNVDDDKFAHLFIFSFSLSGDLSSFFENKVFTLNDRQVNIITSTIEFIREKTHLFPEKTENDTNPLPLLSKTSTNLFIVANYIYTLFLSLCEGFNVAEETDNENTKIFKTAVNFMNENLHLPLTIKNIAEKCCISATGLKKIFMEYSGLGVHKYFLKLKLSRATSLISEGKNINLISETLGFSSQAYFSCAFKREMGCTPSEYKNTNIYSK